MANRRLKTVDEIIEVIGRQRLIEITDCTTNSITNWRSAGSFPANTLHTITKELAKLGHSASPELFAQKPHPSDRAA